MLVRRILLVLVFLGFAGLGAWLYYFYEPGPDERLACYYGAYETDDGQLAVISPTSGRQALRMVVLNGQTWRLEPLASDVKDIPSTFSAKVGWSERKVDGASVDFGSCAAGTITTRGNEFPNIVARKRTLDITEATFDSHGQKLFGRLVMPRLEGAIPVAVLVHGSEWDSAVVFNRLQYLLPANGIGVFVYDKRGTGKSQGKYTQDFDLLADDAAAALTKAKALAGGLASEVGFQGGSQAGWIEPLAALKAKADFVLVGFGLAESPLAEDRDEVFDDLRTAGYGDDVIEKAREITTATGRVIASGFRDGYAELDAVRAKYSKEPWYPKANGELTGVILGYPNWLTWLVGPFFLVGTPMEYDPLPPLKAYEGPHLWILAGRDSSAPSENTLRILREVQKTRPNLQIVMFPTADHGITEFEEKNGERIDTRFSDGYFQLMVDWLLFREPKVRVAGPIVYQGGGAAVTPTAAPLEPK